MPTFDVLKYAANSDSSLWAVDFDTRTKVVFDDTHNVLALESLKRQSYARRTDKV